MWLISGLLVSAPTSNLDHIDPDEYQRHVEILYRWKGFPEEYARAVEQLWLKF